MSQKKISDFFSTKSAPNSDVDAEMEIDLDDEVNQAFAASDSSSKRKRGKYSSYSDEKSVEIGMYAARHSTATAVKFFKKEYFTLNESTVRSMRDKYREAVRRLQSIHGATYDPTVHIVRSLESKAAGVRGRPLTLGTLDKVVINKLQDIRASGGIVSARLALCLANSTLAKEAPHLKKENGGRIDLTRSWAVSLFKRMNFTKRSATTGKLQLPQGFVEEASFRFVRAVRSAINAPKTPIPDSLVLNWDQTPLKYVPSSRHTMAEKGSSKVAIAGLSDKRNITAVFTVSLAGDCLPFQLVYAGKTDKSQPSISFPEGFDVTQNETHWSNEITMCSFITNVIGPYLSTVRARLGNKNQTALVIYDAFRAHTTEKVQRLLKSLNVICLEVPTNMTDILQPLDLSVNRAAKNFLEEQFSTWYAEQVLEVERSSDSKCKADNICNILKSTPVLRDLHAKWVVLLYKHMQQPNQKTIIKNGFRKAGIVDKKYCEPRLQSVDPFEKYGSLDSRYSLEKVTRHQSFPDNA